MVSSRCGPRSKASSSASQRGQPLLHAALQPAERVAQAPLAVAIVLPHRVGDAVRVEHEQVAGLERHVGRRPALAVEGARRSCRDRPTGVTSPPRTSSGGGWPALAIVTTAVPSSRSLQRGEDHRAQRQARVCAAQRVVEPRDGGARVARELPAVRSVKRASDVQRGGLGALAGDVADQEHPALRAGEDVVEVAADLVELAGRAVQDGRGPAGHVRQLGRQQAVLQRRGRSPCARV